MKRKRNKYCEIIFLNIFFLFCFLCQLNPVTNSILKRLPAMIEAPQINWANITPPYTWLIFSKILKNKKKIYIFLYHHHLKNPRYINSNQSLVLSQEFFFRFYLLAELWKWMDFRKISLAFRLASIFKIFSSKCWRNARKFKHTDKKNVKNMLFTKKYVPAMIKLKNNTTNQPKTVLSSMGNLCLKQRRKKN